MPRSSRGAPRTSSATARPDRGPVARPWRNFPLASRRWQQSWRALARRLLNAAIAPPRTRGAGMVSTRLRTFAMGTYFVGTHTRDTSGRSAMQHVTATTRHVRRHAASTRSCARTEGSRDVRASMFRALLTLLKRAAEFSSDKIAPAFPGFHVMNDVAGSCLERAVTRFEIALTRSEQER